MQFSLMFFGAGGEAGAADRYDEVLAVARAVDGSPIGAIWTPERHYHPFGGLFPQPAVLSAAIAASTRHVRIRAGSVVAPLHRAEEIVEQWAVVDALSGGRVDLALASGWNSVDFWTDPGAFSDRHALVEQRYEEIRHLWRHREFSATPPDGVERRIRLYPAPVQSDITLSLAAAGNPETFRTAGRLGARILTHLLGQSVEQLTENVATYKTALADAGHDPNSGHVAVMLHTHLAEDRNQALAVGTEALTEYLMVSIDLDLTDRPGAAVERARRREMAELRARRHVASTALIGNRDDALERLAPLQHAGVDEVAFLIDFSLPAGSLESQASLLAEWAPALADGLRES